MSAEPAPSPLPLLRGRAAGVFGQVLLWAGLAAVAAVAILAIDWSAAYIFFPYESLDRVEGRLLAQALRLREGRSIYPDPVESALACPHPPLYQAVCAALVRVLGPRLVGPRLLSAAAALAVAVMATRFVSSFDVVEGRNRPEALCMPVLSASGECRLDEVLGMGCHISGCEPCGGHPQVLDVLDSPVGPPADLGDYHQESGRLARIPWIQWHEEQRQPAAQMREASHGRSGS